MRHAQRESGIEMLGVLSQHFLEQTYGFPVVRLAEGEHRIIELLRGHRHKLFDSGALSRLLCARKK